MQLPPRFADQDDAMDPLLRQDRGEGPEVQSLIPAPDNRHDRAGNARQRIQQTVGRGRLRIIDDRHPPHRPHRLQPVLKPSELPENLVGERVRNVKNPARLQDGLEIGGQGPAGGGIQMRMRRIIEIFAKPDALGIDLLPQRDHLRIGPIQDGVVLWRLAGEQAGLGRDVVRPVRMAVQMVGPEIQQDADERTELPASQ